MVRIGVDMRSQRARVRFVLPAGVEAEAASVVGDFNEWDESATQMKLLKNGDWVATLLLPRGERFEFRYRLRQGGGTKGGAVAWVNDDSCESCANAFGEDNSVLRT